MRHSYYGSCILSNLLELLTIMHFYFNTMHKSMSNFTYKHEIKKISMSWASFPYIDEILNFVNDEVQY